MNPAVLAQFPYTTLSCQFPYRTWSAFISNASFICYVKCQKLKDVFAFMRSDKISYKDTLVFSSRRSSLMI